MTQRRDDIDRAKGLAILLVVFGHLVARADPIGVGWYEPLRRAVYAFHMPFFLYLSGLAAVLSGAVLTAPAGWPALAAARARRLLVPFFALGLLVLALKVAAGTVLFVDNAPSGFWAGLGGLFWRTRDSPARSVWYLLVVFWCTLAAPWVLRWGGSRGLLAIGLAAYGVAWPDVCYADELGRYAVFFALGVACGLGGGVWLRFVDAHWRWLALLFLAGLVCIIRFGDVAGEKLTLLSMGVISMPVLHGFVRNYRHPPSGMFLFLGRYCFMIYLFNTLFIGAAKGVLLRFASWDGAHFPGFAAVLMLAGTLGPVALKIGLLRRSKVLDRLTN